MKATAHIHNDFIFLMIEGKAWMPIFHADHIKNATVYAMAKSIPPCVSNKTELIDDIVKFFFRTKD